MVSLSALGESEGSDDPAHPYLLSTTELRDVLGEIGIDTELMESLVDGREVMLLPSHDRVPDPSPHIAHLTGLDVPDEQPAVVARFAVEGLVVPAERVLDLLTSFDVVPQSVRQSYGSSLRYWIVVSRFICELLATQRFIPTLAQQRGGSVQAGWRLWLRGDRESQRLETLFDTMPHSTRCVVGSCDHQPREILERFLESVSDAVIRSCYVSHDLISATSRWKDSSDAHVAWLGGLLGAESHVQCHPEQSRQLMRGAGEWLGRLDQSGRPQSMCLRFELEEPPDAALYPDLVSPDDTVHWMLTFHLQSTDDPSFVLDAKRIWSLSVDTHTIGGRRIDHPHDLLLGELTRAAKVFPDLEKVLDEPAPCSIQLTTEQVYLFLREIYPLLEESGFSVHVPEWWGTPETRLSARLLISSDDEMPVGSLAGDRAGEAPMDSPLLGLESLVDYSWRIAVGDQVLTGEEFHRLANHEASLIRLQGRWIEVRPKDIRRALDFLERPEDDGRISIREALRLAYGSTREETGLPVLGMETTGWVSGLFGGADESSDSSFPMVPQPDDFVGTLRPYQVKGLSWLAMLDRFGLGACLADDMGLGKTIQLIALLLWERQVSLGSAKVGPTLLVVPMSVVGNWVREIRRFGPSLHVLVHHGTDRLAGEALLRAVDDYDVVITTYALAYRDREDIGSVHWWRVGLDEAQNIKNPTSKQSLVIRSFKADRRVTLTGTPIENRLSELWSIMDFCSPGFFGTVGEFRREYAVPIERFRDRSRGIRLRQLIQPFILRRLKTDPKVISDLPDKLEYKVYCNLTAEQARLYEQVVDDMLRASDSTTGIQRRGQVLASLTRLKQICNHPVNFLGQPGKDSTEHEKGTSGRSGKTARLVEMLEEVLAEGDSALVFTQYRQMGHLLESIIRRELDIDPLYLHGGSPAKKRDQMIDRFQERDGSSPIFILSLKAGGFGLNLTAANHVFHFDRWWNPAVENQATDRAFRIGQTRSVQVHKYVCSGTLEERIDQMIEQKVELADHIVGSGEQWLTELTTEQLQRMVALRHDEVADEPEIEDAYLDSDEGETS